MCHFMKSLPHSTLPGSSGTADTLIGAAYPLGKAHQIHVFLAYALSSPTPHLPLRRRSSRIRFSILDTWTWEIPMIFPTSDWVFSAKYLR